MIRLGKHNIMEVVREVDFGMYLDAGEVGEVLIPGKYIPEGTQIGDKLRVFLHLDSEERLVATTEEPKVEVNEFAYLQVKWVNEYGAFLDWGLTKDLFCPFKEQKTKMVQGKSYIIFCYIDPVTYRIVASAKVDKFLSDDMPPYHSGEEVDILIQQKSDLGMKAIVDGQYRGLIFDNEIFQPLHTGDRLKAYVKQVRPDGKIDLKLQRYFGKKRITTFSDQLLIYLKTCPDGFCPLHDKSEAEEIYSTFGVSKKTFKRGVGDLYKHQFITLHPDGIRLTPKGAAEGTED